MSDSLWPHELHARPPCPSPTPEDHTTQCSLSQWCHPTISSSVAPFSSCPVFPSIRVFSNQEKLFTSGGQSIRASTSAPILPMNIQGWFSSGLTGLITLLSNGLSRVFSSTTVLKHQFSVLSLFYSPALISICDYWKDHIFDYTDLCRQSDVSAFLIHCLALS